MKPVASNSNPANPIAGTWLAVFGSLRGSWGWCRCGCTTSPPVAPGSVAILPLAPGAPACRGRCRWRWRDDRHHLRGQHVEFTKIVRILVGFALESAADLDPFAEHRVGHLGFFRVIERQGIGTGLGRARCLWYALDGPFLRARQHVLVQPFRRAPHCLNQTSHRGNLPALVLRQQVPVPSLRVCRFDSHHTESERQRPLHHTESEKPSVDLLSLWTATTDPLVPDGQHHFCVRGKPIGAA